MPGKSGNDYTTPVDLELDESDIAVKGKDSDHQNGKLIEVLYHGSICSAKEFRLSSSAERMKMNERLMKACQKWVQLRHPHIVWLIGIYKPKAIFPNVPLLVVEKIDCDLQSLLSDHHEIPVEVQLSILQDVALGLKYLHNQKTPLVHGNLSTKTILLTTQLRAKISGIEGVQAVKPAKSSATKAKPKSASLKSPSDKETLDLPTDVYSYGLVLLHTATHQQPKLTNSGGVEQHQSCIDKMEDDTKCFKPLIELCIHADAQKRPKINDVSKQVEEMANKMPWSSRNSGPLVLQAEHGKKETDFKKHKDEKIELASNYKEHQDHQVEIMALQRELESMKKENDQLKQRLQEHSTEKNLHSQQEDQVEHDNAVQGTTGEHDLFGSCTPNNTTPNQGNDLRHKTGNQDSSMLGNLPENENTQSQNDTMGNEPGSSTRGHDHDPNITGNIPEETNIESQDDTTVNGQGSNTGNQNSTTGKEPRSVTGGKNDKTGNDPESNTGDQDTMGNKPKNTRGQDMTGNEPFKNTGGQDAAENRPDCNVGGKNTMRNEPENTAAGTGNKPKPTDDKQPQRELRNEALPGVPGEQSVEVKATPKGKPPPRNESVGVQHFLPYTFPTDGLGPKVIGYNNLGNTCFFNSMLQSVHQTPLLHHVMAGRKKSYKIPDTEMDNLEVTVSGSVTMELHNFFSGVNKLKNSIAPRSLLNSLGRINKRFGRGTQEDSHEVMRSLLSALREEEISCIKEQIKSHFTGRSRVASFDGETKLDMKACLSKASKGVCEVDQLIGTLLVTTTICHHCCNPLEIEELCLDLSLPMPTDPRYSYQSMYDDWTEPGPSKKFKAQNNKSQGNKKNGGKSGNPPAVQRQGSKDKKRKDSTRGACGPGNDVEDNVDGTETFNWKELVNDIDLPYNKAKFNAYLEVCNLQYSQAFQRCKKESFSTDLEQCLADFTDLDVLDEYNKFICQNCSTDKNLEVTERRVSKQILIHQLPPVLILHMKRFSIGHTVTKDNQHVSFSPVLNMAPFCTNECVQRMADKENKILYGLYAVVVHGGSLHGGHYTANVRRRQPVHEQVQTPKGDSWKYDERAAHQGDWYHISDSYVSSRSNFSSVAGSQAYLLFYELLPITN